MSRSVRLAAVTALVVLVAALPSSATASTKPGSAAAAAKVFAVLRTKARPSDDVLRALGTKRRTLPRGARARRIASGKGHTAYLVAGASVMGGVRRATSLQLIVVDGRDASATQPTVASAARRGAGLAERLGDGSYWTVAVLPDGARQATMTSGGRVRALRIRRNAVAAVTRDAGTIAFTAADGSTRSVPISGAYASTESLAATATLLEGSKVTLDLGNGVVRDVPLSGTVSATLPNGYQLASTNTFAFTSADLHVGATDLLTDACAAPALARLNPATGVTLDPKGSSGSLAATGEFAVTAAVGLRVVLDVRGDQGCGGPASTSGYADTGGLTFSLAGKLGAGSSLAHFTLTSAPTPVTVNGCMVAGDPAKPCAQGTTAVRATATLALVVRLQIGGEARSTA